jgi:hypothetical protein
MSEEKKILVVGLVETDDASTDFIPREAFADFEEQTAYEVALRLGVGKSLPDLLMITVSSQDELRELINALGGENVRFTLMTNSRAREVPQTMEDLMAQLPQSVVQDDDDTTGNDNNLFRIL